MNPQAINTTNVSQFGFYSYFLLESNKIRFDIAGLTLFKTGGAAAVQGISFEVIDPSGVPLVKVGFTPPHIDPDVATTFEVSLPTGISKFGHYNIKGVLKEANGTEYTITLPPKLVCAPDGWDEKLLGVPGNFELKVDCKAPYLRVNETTPIAYQGLPPYSKTKAGMLYYPQGTVNPIPFTFTPFETTVVYTGTYTIRNKTTARFDLKDSVFVDIAYKTTLEKKITCQSSVVDILCCLEKVQDEMETYCNQSRGDVAKQQLFKATIPLVTAIAKEQAGLDASDEIDQIREILNCDCNCGPKLIEPQLAGPPAPSYTFQGVCASTTTPTPLAGNTTRIDVKTKYTQVRKGDALDLAYSISKVEDDCNIYYDIKFDYNVLTSTIITTIKNTPAFISQLQMILNTGSSTACCDLTGLDGKCVVDLTKTNYSLLIPGNSSIVKIIKAITINGVVHTAPSTPIPYYTDTVTIAAWLNSLALGTFTVVNQPGTGGAFSIVITTNNNQHTLSTLLVVNETVGGDENYQFAGVNITVKGALQAIFDYICAINATQIKHGAGQDVCSIDANGRKQVQNYGTTALLSTILAAMNNSICSLIDYVLNTAALTCDKIKQLFQKRNTAFDPSTDFILGTKQGACAQLSADELATIVLTQIGNNTVLLQNFCRMIGQCNTGTNPPVPQPIRIIGTVGTTNINITAIAWDILPAANQVVSFYIRPCPASGSTPAFVLVNGTVTVQPNGTLVSPSPLNIAPVNPNSCYQVMVQNNAGGNSFVQTFYTPPVSAVNNVKFNNMISGSTITDIRFNGVALLSSPIPYGTGGVGVDIGALAGTSYALAFLAPSAGSGQEMYWEHRRSGALIASGYITYTGALTTIGNFILQNGDDFTIGRAIRHLMDVFYVASGGSIINTCELVGAMITRDAIAIQDASHSGHSVRVTIEVKADNGCDTTITVDIAPAAAGNSFNSNNDCNGHPCIGIISFQILSIIEI